MNPKRLAMKMIAGVTFLLVSVSMCNFTERGVQGMERPVPD